MDREELIARVTCEVMSRLGIAGADGASGVGECDPCTACGLCVEKRPEDVDSIIASGAARISAAGGLGDAGERVAAMIDHTVLKPDATREEIEKLCEEAEAFPLRLGLHKPELRVLCARRCSV